ncbi:unnamed protein product [Brassicogethes aeneus]|uniref:THAP-type domain-containing protein n=1 Tax=Brassicogethes aeneus TaxID=1431903 RepID=A0A9P0ARK3_BRAAE|nr:unnamed protein product [Brassicogethes aeneus]
MVAVYCAVNSCWGSKESKHSFPNPSKNLDLFNKWVKLCANKRLLEMTPQKIYTNCRVCAKHFTLKDFLRNNRLGRQAYPTLLLPDESGANNSNGDFPQPMEFIKVEPTDCCDTVEEILPEENLEIKEEDLSEEIDMEFAEQCIDYAIKYLKQRSKTNNRLGRQAYPTLLLPGMYRL